METSGTGGGAIGGWTPSGSGALLHRGAPGGSEPANRQAQNAVPSWADMPADEYGMPGRPSRASQYGAWGQDETPEQYTFPGRDEPPGQFGMPTGEYRTPDHYEEPADGSGWPADQAGSAWPLPEPQPGWFGRHNPDLWILGAGVFVAGAALVAAFAAASGATATGYAPAPHATATHATASNPQATRPGAAPVARPACVSPAITAAGR